MFPDAPPGLGKVAEDVLDKPGSDPRRSPGPMNTLCPVAVDVGFLLVYKTHLTAAGNTEEMELAVSVRLRHKASIPEKYYARETKPG